MEQEIDVGPYLVAIWKRWPWILACAVSAALVAFSGSMLLPKTYLATAKVLVFVRQTGSQLGTNQPFLNVETIDAGARRQGLVALAGSDTIEAQLPAEIARRIVSTEYRPGMIVQGGQIKVSADGDLLEITAVAQSPERAQELANAWADTYVAHVAKLYNDKHSSVQLAGAALLPLAPSGPPIARNSAMAGMAGTLLGITLALISALRGTSSLVPGRVRPEHRATQPSPTR